MKAFAALMRAMLLIAGLALPLADAGAATQDDRDGGQVTPPLAAEFVRPHQMIDIGGRALNLFCMGKGKVTVLFEAGASDWSVVWALVQPAVAKTTRACSYDRAGLGYSDSAPGPRSPFAIAEDLHRLIAAGKLAQPLILVGHSLGGFNAKLHAAFYPDDVAGLVLLDPAEERDAARARAFITARWGAGVATRSELGGQLFLTNLIDRFRHCAEVSRDRPLDPSTRDYRRCTDPPRAALGPVIAAERTRLQQLGKYQEVQASEILFSPYGDARPDAAYANLLKPGVLGDRPLLVLTPTPGPATDPIDRADNAAAAMLRAETARLARHGCIIEVTRTSHNIQIDRPDAVIEAVDRVVRLLGGGIADRGDRTPPAVRC